MRGSYRSARIPLALIYGGLVLGIAANLPWVLGGPDLPSEVALTMTMGAVALCLSSWYLPGVELLRPDEKPRWSRWSKGIIFALLVPIIVNLISGQIG